MPNLPPPGMSPPLPGGLCLSPGLGSLSGVAAPPDKAAGAQRAGVGRGLTGPPPVTVATARGGPLKGPRHRGHRAGQGHKGHGPAVLASPPRAAAEPPPSGISGPSQPPALVWGGDSVGSPQLSCAPPPLRFTGVLCDPRDAMCSPAPPIGTLLVWPPHTLPYVRCPPIGVLSPHGCCVSPPLPRSHGSTPLPAPRPVAKCHQGGGGHARLQWRCRQRCPRWWQEGRGHLT